MFSDLKGELEEDAVSISSRSGSGNRLQSCSGLPGNGFGGQGNRRTPKSCQMADRAKGFCSLTQTYAWLAQCFLDKGVPEGAFAGTGRFSRPNIDEDTRTAVHYEPAAAYESAQNRGDALSRFLQFYGTNIDYRHVGERIKALRS